MRNDILLLVTPGVIGVTGNRRDNQIYFKCIASIARKFKFDDVVPEWACNILEQRFSLLNRFETKNPKNRPNDTQKATGLNSQVAVEISNLMRFRHSFILFSDSH